MKNPRTGEQIFTGWPRGSEGFGDAPGQSWRAYIMDPQEPMRVGFFKYFLFHDPNWDYRSIDWERDLAYAEQKMPFMAAVDRDLTPFKKRGGKLLMYTGWSDPVVPPQDTVAYYDAVVKTMGGLEKTREFYRFFLAPGMGHCSGGPGPNQFDHLTALEQWVEKGDRAGQDDRDAQHRRQGRSDAAAVCSTRWSRDGRARAAPTKRPTSRASPTPARARHASRHRPAGSGEGDRPAPADLKSARWTDRASGATAAVRGTVVSSWIGCALAGSSAADGFCWRLQFTSDPIPLGLRGEHVAAGAPDSGANDDRLRTIDQSSAQGVEWRPARDVRRNLDRRRVPAS